MVLNPEHVRANPLAAVREAIAVALQVPVLQNDLVLAVGAVNRDTQRLFAVAFESFWFRLIPMGFGDQTVQVRLQHGARPLLSDLASLAV